MALVLLMEGTNQFISWRHVIEFINNTFDPLIDTTLSETSAEYIEAWNETINSIFENTFLPLTEDIYEKITSEFANITNPDITEDEAGEIFQSVLVDLLKLVFNGYGFEPPEEEAETGDADVLNAYFAVFQLVFEYFFISAGIVLIFLGILSWLSHSKGLHESRSHLIGIISKIAIGLGLVFCSMMVLTSAADNLGESAWTLPLLLFLLGIALVLNHIPWGNIKKSENTSMSISRKPKSLSWGILGKSKSRKNNFEMIEVEAIPFHGSTASSRG
jgi:hypothetical protein